MTLIELYKYAYNKVPVYNKIGNEKKIDIKDSLCFNDVPFIEKSDLLKNPDDNISAEYIMDYYRGKLKKTCTSGSTGTCLDIYWNKEDYYKSITSLSLIRKKRFNVMPNDKMCFFYTKEFVNEIQEKNCGGINYFNYKNYLGISKLSLNKDNMMDIYDKIIEFQPVWMSIQPSIALILAKTFIEKKLEKISSLKLVELTGERYTTAELQCIKDFFDCNVVSQYGCNEINSIAYECECGKLHCNELSAYVEVAEDGILKEDGEEGNIYITSRINKTMPIVRYGIGDRGKIYHNVKCECGNNSPVLELTAARRDDFIINKDGTKTSPNIFINTIETINADVRKIIIFKIIQTDYNMFNIKYVIDKEYYDDYFEDSYRYIEEMFYKIMSENGYDNYYFEFEAVDELKPSLSNGKLSFFERLR